MQAALPDRLGQLQATGPHETGPARHDRDPVLSLARRYEGAGRSLYVQILDTAQAPELRASVLRTLRDAGAVTAPMRKAVSFASGQGVATAFPEHRSSGVTGLIAGRYFVSARLEGVADTDEVARLVQSLRWSALPSLGADGSAGGGAR